MKDVGSQAGLIVVVRRSQAVRGSEVGSAGGSFITFSPFRRVSGRVRFGGIAGSWSTRN